jgi:hypothetical protein
MRRDTDKKIPPEGGIVGAQECELQKRWTIEIIAMLDSRQRMVEYAPSEKFFKKFFENPRKPLDNCAGCGIIKPEYSIPYAVYSNHKEEPTDDGTDQKASTRSH